MRGGKSKSKKIEVGLEEKVRVATRGGGERDRGGDGSAVELMQGSIIGARGSSGAETTAEEGIVIVFSNESKRRSSCSEASLKKEQAFV